MPRKLRIEKRREVVDNEMEAWLHSDDSVSGLFKYSQPDELRALWVQHRERIIQEYVSEYPGERPPRWWEFDAPEPRQRLGGSGTASQEVLGHTPYFKFGIPAIWITTADIAFYMGRSRDINNQPASQYGGRDFAGVAIDPEDPPVFESQAAYLKRLGLLLAGEGRRSDYAPESVVT